MRALILSLILVGCGEVSDAPDEETEGAALSKRTWIVEAGAASVIYADPPWWVHSCQPVGDDGVEECVDISTDVGSYDGRLCRLSDWGGAGCDLESHGDARLVVTTIE